MSNEKRNDRKYWVKVRNVPNNKCFKFEFSSLKMIMIFIKMASETGKYEILGTFLDDIARKKSKENNEESDGARPSVGHFLCVNIHKVYLDMIFIHSYI